MSRTRRKAWVEATPGDFVNLVLRSVGREKACRPGCHCRDTRAEDRRARRAARKVIAEQLEDQP